MTGSFWPSGFVAALFALHPLHVESVAWISERKDVQSTFFWLLTMWSYAWYVKRPRIPRYLLVIFCFILGLMSKPMLVTLPFVLLLLDFWPLNRIRLKHQTGNGNFQQKFNALRLFWEKTPFFVLSVISSAVTLYAQKQGGAVASLDLIPLNVRFFNAPVSYVKYIGKMFWPSKLALLYPHPGVLSWYKVTGACFLLVSIFFLAIRVVKQSPFFLVGWLWYVETLVPVIGLVQVGSQSMADRYTYVPAIGIFIIFAWGVPELLARWPYKKKVFCLLAILLFLTLMTATWKQVQIWKNSITVSEHALEVTSNNWQMHNNLGLTLSKHGQVDEAIEHYLEALRIKPYFENLYNNLGTALSKKGRIDEAIDNYLKALRLNPDYGTAHYNLGTALDKQGHTIEAIEHYLIAVRLDPKFTNTYNNLGNALAAQGKFEEAVEYYLKALNLNAGFVEVHSNLGATLFRLGKIDQAISHFREALKLKPGNPALHFELGNLHHVKGELDAAINQYQKALAIQPKHPEALNNLALIYAAKGKHDKTLSLYKQIIHLFPDYAATYYNIACIYSIQHKIEESVVWLKRAVKKGYDNWDLIKSDKDLENIRSSLDYKEFIKAYAGK